MLSDIQRYLISKKDEKYCDFIHSLCNTCEKPMIGVRLPILREYAKELVKQDNTAVFKDEYFDEIMLHGFYIAYNKTDFKTKCKQIDEFVPLIDNWSVCDSFVNSLKFIKKNRNEYFPKLKKYLNSKKEFYQRYGLTVLLHHYVTDEYLEDIFDALINVKYNGYYSLMAGAWLLSWCFIYHYDETLCFVKKNEINEFVYKKGIQKSLESYRISDDNKQTLRNLLKQHQ